MQFCPECVSPASEDIKPHINIRCNLDICTERKKEVSKFVFYAQSTSQPYQGDRKIVEGKRGCINDKKKALKG